MRLGRILAIALENMMQRRLRTSLTTLGVVIGMTAMVSLASLGEGFRLEVRERMQEGFELDVLTVIPGSFIAALREPFTAEEVNRVRNVTGVKLATPLITLPQATLYASDGVRINALTVAGVNFSEIAQMIPERFVPIEGDIPSPWEDDVVVLGYKTCFLNSAEPLVRIGESVIICMQAGSPPHVIDVKMPLRVAAILDKGGTHGVTNFDYWAFIPIDTAANIVKMECYNLILVKVYEIDRSEDIARDIGFVFDNPYAVSVLVPIAFIRQVDLVLSLVQTFLIAIASISLLVAGIGITNIMTVSVIERTREIGILKAIGAKNSTVFAIFLAEAMLIGVAGGLIGTFTGYGLSYALAHALPNFFQPQRPLFKTTEVQEIFINPALLPEWTALAFAFTIAVCVVFGLYPAMRAAKLDPVEALRYE